LKQKAMMTPEERRSHTMRAVRSKNTKPELIVRSLAHSMGYRFRLYRKDLPGSPDLIFPRRHKVIFVHGCFWHGHDCQRGARVPKTNTDYWLGKIGRNQKRDFNVVENLQKLGWDALILWECELKYTDEVKLAIETFLGEPPIKGNAVHTPSEYLVFQLEPSVWAVEHLITKYIYGIRFKSQIEAQQWAANRSVEQKLKTKPM